jgi:hypothetical protein
MEAKMVSETLGFYPQLTRLVAGEDLIEKNIVNIITQYARHQKSAGKWQQEKVVNSLRMRTQSIPIPNTLDSSSIQ